MTFLPMLLIPVLAAAGGADTVITPARFDVNDIAPVAEAPVILPWKVLSLDPGFGGIWMTAGDLDGDGEAEVVTAENFNVEDVHYTSAAAAQKLDGTVLWSWGEPDKGRKGLHHDVACQIHDWDNDGHLEVIVAADRAVVTLDGKTGKEKNRFAIPEGASDSIVFCDLEGKGYAADVLVKTRYTQIWAYDYSGKELWNSEMPGGYRTAHQPRPMDIDGDGRTEIFAGFAMLNADGTVRWVFQSEAVDLNRGHLDCARVMVQGKTAEETRIALTCCGANNLACVDGNGKVLWERSGHHFESINVGAIVPDAPSPQLLVDIDHMPENESPLVVVDADGNFLGRIVANYCRQHRLLDWNGDGLEEFAVGGNQALYDGTGKRIAVFKLYDARDESTETGNAVVMKADMTGNGVPDLIFVTGKKIYIYRNEQGLRPEPAFPKGSGVNVTLY